ncbi:MAG: hypothetical protein LUB56_02665 [Coprobacillus sp.]|nr:hypothetical protein [Coprobacillus sp.]
MKNRTILTSIMLVPLLLACTDHYSRIPIETVSDPGLVEISAEEAHERTAINCETLVLLIGSSGCAECNDVARDLDVYAKIVSIYIYYVDMVDASETDWLYIVNATVHDGDDTDYFAWPSWGEEAYFPTIYIFYTGYVIDEGQTDFVDFLDKRLEFTGDYVTNA